MPKKVYIVLRGKFYSGNDSPDVVTPTKKAALIWLKNNYWVKSKGSHNAGLWEKQIGDFMYYAKIEEVDYFVGD